jgi:hypothetical protein
LRKNKQTLSAFKAAHRFCCYCGGQTPTDQKEHAPPKILFKDKWRPDQLIVPACGQCNQSFAQTDQIVALLARATRSWTRTGLDLDRLEQMLHQGIAQNCPELLTEWGSMSRRQLRRLRALTGLEFEDVPALNFGPQTLRHFQAFGARMAFALHYHHTKRIIPESGGVVVEVKTLQHQMNGWRLPNEISQILGPPRTLAQGRKGHVGDQFMFACGPDTALTFYFLTLGMDYAFLLFVAEDRTDFDPAIARGSHVHKAGDFYSFPLPFSLGPIRFNLAIDGQRLA